VPLGLGGSTITTFGGKINESYHDQTEENGPHPHRPE